MLAAQQTPAIGRPAAGLDDACGLPTAPNEQRGSVRYSKLLERQTAARRSTTLFIVFGTAKNNGYLRQDWHPSDSPPAAQTQSGTQTSKQQTKRRRFGYRRWFPDGDHHRLALRHAIVEGVERLVNDR